MHKTLLVVIFPIYVLLVSAYIYTFLPQADEGMFADPAAALASHGYLGSRLTDPTATFTPGVPSHIYYVPPLHLLLLAGVYTVLGQGLFATRLVCAIFGAVFLIFWWLYFRKPWYVVALALDGVFVVAAANGRMDMECAALGYAAIITYLKLREHRFETAVCCAGSLLALAGLSHPNAVFYLIDLLVITIWLDRKHWTWHAAGLALAPFIVGGVAWGIYILQSPGDFAAQFLANLSAGGRTNYLSHPLQALYREAALRYGTAFGIHNPLTALKAITLFAYLGSVIVWCANRKFRRHSRIGPLLLVAGLNALLLGLLDGQKRVYYLIHVIPPLNAALIAWVLWMAESGRRAVALLVVLACAGVQIALHVSRIRSDPYHREYLAAANFVKQHLTPATKLVYIPPEYGFALGFEPPMTHDRTLGYYSHRKADLIVTTECYNGVVDTSGLPAAFAGHVAEVLRHSRLVYNRPRVQVFVPE